MTRSVMLVEEISVGFRYFHPSPSLNDREQDRTRVWAWARGPVFSFCPPPASSVAADNALRVPRPWVPHCKKKGSGSFCKVSPSFCESSQVSRMEGKKLSARISCSVAFPRQTTHLHCEQWTHHSIIVFIYLGVGKIEIYFIHQIN